MGLESLLGAAGRVVVSYKADTSDFKAGIREMAGVEKKAAQERLAHIEAGNKKLEDTKKGWEGVAAKVALAGGSIALAAKGLEAYGKKSWENQQQVDKITKSLSTGLNDILAGIGSIVVAFGPLIEVAGKFASIIGGVASTLGEILGGDVSDGVAAALIARGASPDEVRKALGKGGGTTVRPGGDDWTASIQAGGVMRGIAGRVSPYFNDEIDMGASGYEMNVSSEISKRDAARKAAADAARSAQEKAEREFEEISEHIRQVQLALSQEEALRRQSEALTARTSGIVSGARSDYGAESAGVGAALGKFYEAGGEMDRRTSAAYADYAHGKSQSRLEEMFGPVDEISGYATAFNMLSGSVTSALSAWIDGSQSAGAAFKAFIGEAVKGLAIQMTIEALKHGAYALGSLAFGDFRGAAMHGKAAAAYAAGAVVAAGAAKSLHSSGGSAGGGGYSPGAPSQWSGNRDDSSGGSQTIVLVGDPFADDSPRQRRLNIDKAVNRTRGAAVDE